MVPLCKAINAEFARKDGDGGRVVYRGVVDPEWTVMRCVWYDQVRGAAALMMAVQGPAGRCASRSVLCVLT